MSRKSKQVDTEAVRLAFRVILGREPENDDVITAHLSLETPEKLGAALLASAEFKSKYAQSQHAESKWVAVDVIDRYIMWVDLHDRYVSHGCLNNNWEPDETSFFISRLREGDTVLDIGANIGWFSLVAAKHVGPNGCVHAFEPRPETAKMLARTLSMNNLRKIISLWEYALADTAGDLSLTWGRNTENPGGSHIAYGDMPDHETVTIRAVRLDDLLPEVTPDVIKIDVEGAEPMVFAGAENALLRGRPVILSEIFPQQLENISGRTAAQYIQQMEMVGYQCYLLENGRPTRRLHDFPTGYGRELASVVFEWRSA